MTGPHSAKDCGRARPSAASGAGPTAPHAALHRTNAPGIYAAGDVARFYNPALGTLLRVEHEDNANTIGRVAGRAMAGAAERYYHLPFFYSDLFDLGYEAVGKIDLRFEVVADWQELSQRRDLLSVRRPGARCTVVERPGPGGRRPGRHR